MTEQERPGPAGTPPASRPDLPASYGVPPTAEGMLPWSHAVERIRAARNYWVSTTRPDGRPHAVPVWGVWVDETFFHGGGPDTRKARNLAVNPAVSVHLESGDEVVIVEGTVDRITADHPDQDLLRRIDDAYEAKYGMRHGTPVWALRPRVAFAWRLEGFPTTMTRWTFAPRATGEVP
ncbi:MAG TPA: pyridoxamine 5'-phosphate oxidase family protein [Actinomycetota bacterium]|nr:pyridoxamine 5'-phosphate oxidase family protein [Actinomycetota bacterium]